MSDPFQTYPAGEMDTDRALDAVDELHAAVEENNYDAVQDLTIVLNAWAYYKDNGHHTNE